MQHNNAVFGVLAGVLALASVAVWLITSRGAPQGATLPIVAANTAPDPGTLSVPSSLSEAAPRTVASRPESATRPSRARISPEELLGRVVAHDTKVGIAGAEVQVQFRDADQFWNIDLAYGEQTTVLARLLTDGEGRFSVPVQRALRHRLRVEARGYANKIVPSCVGGAETVVELVRGASLDGVVRCGGKPLADAAVRIAVLGESIELAAGRTDVSGAFRFVGLSPADVFVQVQSALHEEKWQRVTLLPEGAHRVDIEVPVGTTLRGRVVDAATRAPIAGAEVSDSWTFRRVARSVADGTFELAGLTDDGHAVLHVRALGYSTATVNLSGLLAKPAEFALVQGGAVHGRCIDAAGAPVPTAYVAVGASFMESPGMQHTDLIRATVQNDGRFRAAGLRPDQLYCIYVRSPRHGTRVYALPRRLGGGELFEFGDIVLRPGGGIEGEVVDENGEPWPGVLVSIRGSNADSAKAASGAGDANAVTQFTSRSTTTDAHGVFRAASFSAGTYDLRVSMRGRDPTASAKVDVVDGAISQDVQLVVPRGLAIAGTLRFSDGHPLGDEAGDLVLIATAASGARATTRIERGGRFAFSGLPAQPHTIGSSHPPKGWALSPRRGVAAGTQGVDLVLQPAVVVQGRVLDADGKPVKVRVWARQDGDRSGSALISTDDEGHFEIEVPTDFHGSIGAMHPTLTMLQATRDGVNAGQRDVELKLPRH